MIENAWRVATTLDDEHSVHTGNEPWRWASEPSHDAERLQSHAAAAVNAQRCPVACAHLQRYLWLGPKATVCHLVNGTDFICSFRLHASVQKWARWLQLTFQLPLLLAISTAFCSSTSALRFRSATLQNISLTIYAPLRTPDTYTIYIYNHPSLDSHSSTQCRTAVPHAQIAVGTFQASTATVG